MDKVYITGHRNPDTDSIVSAMAYAALKNALGQRAVLRRPPGPDQRRDQSCSGQIRRTAAGGDQQRPDAGPGFGLRYAAYPVPRSDHQPGMADDAGGSDLCSACGQ